ncbi:MAG: tRNA (adenosine(37)-N6)-threonylcarbamoyltransferase complex transferase subunit TsaD [Nitrospirae bacterium]|nr:tRNA (adenosine(37)-N6)-threonylcarbamoyltransferase complex transferase subunit TsaD [Nitrospirota bacterium]
MFILGIDTSCDDTSASIVEDGHKIFSNVVSSQSEIHKKYGGIVPELASRRHIEMIWPVVDEAIKGAGMGIEDISAIAVCHGPGLIGSLLIGVSFAKAVAYAKSLRLVAVNHLEGHIFTAMLSEQRPEFPFLSLIVSGGHTVLYRVDGFGIYRELGRTRDDAAGEAYDKVAKLLGLGYPGGPIIDSLSVKGDGNAIPFPRAYLPGSLDFSFSGLKTAVLNHLKENPGSRKEDIAASFQAAVVEVLIEKTIDTAKRESMKRVALSGGVSANSALRAAMKQRGSEEGIEVYLPLPEFCTDNAAMIAAAGYYHFVNEKFATFDLNPRAYLPL